MTDSSSSLYVNIFADIPLLSNGSLLLPTTMAGIAEYQSLLSTKSCEINPESLQALGCCRTAVPLCVTSVGILLQQGLGIGRVAKGSWGEISSPPALAIALVKSLERGPSPVESITQSPQSFLVQTDLCLNLN